MAATLLGSPEKSHSALKQRYLQSLQNTGMSVEPLKPASSTRINSLSGSPRKFSTSVLRKSPVKNDLYKIKQSYEKEPSFVTQTPVKPSSVLNSRKIFEMSSSNKPLASELSLKAKVQKQTLPNKSSAKSPSRTTPMHN